MTHAINPGYAADKLARILAERDARVLAVHSLHRRRVEVEIPDFVQGVLARFNT